MEAAAEAVASGRRIIIFPEGTRSKDGVVKDFKALQGRPATKSRAPLRRRNSIVMRLTIHYQASSSRGTVEEEVDGSMEVRDMKEHIKTIGLFNSKAKNVIALSQMLIEAMIVGNISTEEASGHPPCTHPLPLATRHFPSARLSRETYLQRSALLSLARKWISWISFGPCVIPKTKYMTLRPTFYTKLVLPPKCYVCFANP